MCRMSQEGESEIYIDRRKLTIARGASYHGQSSHYACEDERVALVVKSNRPSLYPVFVKDLILLANVSMHEQKSWHDIMATSTIIPTDSATNCAISMSVISRLR